MEPESTAEAWHWDPQREVQLTKFKESGLFKDKQLRVLRGFLSREVEELKNKEADKSTIQRSVYKFANNGGNTSDPCRACERMVQRIRPLLEKYYKKHKDDPGPLRVTISNHPSWFPKVIDVSAVGVEPSKGRGRRGRRSQPGVGRQPERPEVANGKNDPIAFTTTSDQKKLRRLLKSPIHAYHLTQDSAGNPAWYHKILTFDASTADGRLIAHGVNLPINATDLEGEEHSYEYDAWLDRSHLIVRTRRKDETSPDMSFQIFPKVGESLNRPPWWGMDAITTTWYDNPAATISIWNPEHELECARGAPNGKAISDPEIMEALENEWRKSAMHARAVQLPSSIRHFKTDAEAFKYLSSLYSSEKLSPKLARIRDTHARLETQPLGFGANYRENGEAFSKFLARGDEHVTRAIVILGDKWDENYVRSFLMEPVRGHEHKIEYFWLPAPILSFIILDYEDGTNEVYFGWGRLGFPSPGVFASKDQDLVQAFSHYFDMLRASAQPVPAASLANPAQLHRERTPLPWLYNTETSDHAIPPLHAVESAARSDSVIYVVTPDLYNDARNPETIALVRANHLRGITYRFFTPDTPKAHINIKLVMQNYAESAKHGSGRYLSFIYLAPELFQTPQCNVLVIDHDKEGRRRVFVELPVDERAERRWWAETDPDTAEWWHTKVKELAKRKPLPNPRRKS